MDVWSDAEGHRSILIAVVVIGESPAQGLNKYLQVLRRNTRFDLESINLPPNNPFKRSSKSTDYLLLNFVDNSNFLKSQWDSLYLYRRVMAVIGLVHCPSNPDLDIAYNQFLQVAKRFPTALQAHCMVFEPLDSQQDLVERKDLVMFPNSDSKHLQFYMNTVMMDIAERLVHDMLGAVISLNASQEFPYTILDSPSLQGDPSKRRRYLPGRIAKQSADYSLLCGIIADAKELYQAAADSARTAGDFVWRAAALEGIVCCDVNMAYEYRMAMLEKACRNYRRRPENIAPLLVGLFMKMARFAASNRFTSDSLFNLSRAYESCTELPIDDKISLVLEAAMLSHSQGASRKFGMFMREASLLYSQKEMWVESHHTLALCAPVYRLSSDSLSGWNTLQLAVLTELIKSAKVLDNLYNACGYMSNLLVKLRHPSDQISTSSDLTRHALLVPANQSIGVIGVPVLTGFGLIEQPETLRPKPRKKAVTPKRSRKHSFEDVFLYRPSASSSTTPKENQVLPLQVACEEIFNIEVSLRNPLRIEVFLSRISACCSGIDYESYPISVLLPPLSEQTFRLPILPLSSGLLNFRSIKIRAFNLDSFHKILSPMSSVFVTPEIPAIEARVEQQPELYFGQATSFSLILHNVGKLVVNDISLRFEINQEALKKPPRFRTPNMSNLCLSVGESVQVLVDIDCGENSGSCLVRISYAADTDANFYRETLLHIPLVIQSGLKIKSLEVYPFASYQSNQESGSSVVEDVVNFSSFGQGDCMVIIEVINTAPDRFCITPKAIPDRGSLSYVVEAMSNRRIIFPLCKESFGDDMDDIIASFENDSSRMHNLSLLPPEFLQCRDTFLDRMNLRWQVSRCDLNASGILCVPPCLVSPSHLRHVIPDPFIFQFELNGSSNPHQPALHDANSNNLISPPVSPYLHSSHRDQQQFDVDRITVNAHNRFYPRGEFNWIRVVLTSRVARPLSMTVSARPCYETSSGTFEYNLQQHLIWTGSWDHYLGIVEPGSVTSVNFPICFLSLGRFMFQLICQCKQSDSSSLVYSSSLPLLIESFDKDLTATPPMQTSLPSLIIE